MVLYVVYGFVNLGGVVDYWSGAKLLEKPLEGVGALPSPVVHHKRGAGAQHPGIGLLQKVRAEVGVEGFVVDYYLVGAQEILPVTESAGGAAGDRQGRSCGNCN